MGAISDASGQDTHRIPGPEAWKTARAAGFEFHPILPDDRYILSGARDGAAATLKSCASSHAPCESEARLVDGEVEILPIDCGVCERSHVFELYGGRRLADGWRIVDVEIVGRSWSFEREPAYGTADPAFALRVEGPSGRAAVAAITLEGPEGAAWPAAFAATGSR
ncbi:MAG TPA: hypothetical protein VM778_15000 [Gemmatimonadota bacterium]|nr:hypothetical protein [Gemmatimonadota bacterium]